MTPPKRRTGPDQPPAARPRPAPAKRPIGSATAQARAPASTPARVTAAKPVKRFRPPSHLVVGIVLLAAGVAVAAVNDAMLLGGVPTWLLPGGHNEGYLVLGLGLAAWSTWWFGWYDRAR